MCQIQLLFLRAKISLKRELKIVLASKGLILTDFATCCV
uniref:Uncharacterized protein n=1 Tax=uncultured bacterium BLR12 TaxID=506514 RepID=C0INF6_9BACT|nr:hypothetical protein AKSOIL_0227 [uncultured bacterium BLR12]